MQEYMRRALGKFPVCGTYCPMDSNPSTGIKGTAFAAPKPQVVLKGHPCSTPAVLRRRFLSISSLVLLSVMLSRFSSFFVYAVAGLVISAAATPMSGPYAYDNGSKAPSYPGSPSHTPPSPKYPALYADGRPYPQPNYPSNPPSTPSGNCNVGEQYCCNPVQVQNTADPDSYKKSYNKDSAYGGILSVLGTLGKAELLEELLHMDNDKFLGTDCSSGGDQCSNQQLCCTGNHFNGLIAIGCVKLDLTLPK